MLTLSNNNSTFCQFCLVLRKIRYLEKGKYKRVVVYICVACKPLVLYINSTATQVLKSLNDYELFKNITSKKNRCEEKH